MKSARLLAAVSSLTVAVSTASGVIAGAWTQSEGHGQVVASSTYTKSTRGFDDGGSAEPIPAFEKMELNLLLEYGWTDWLTLMLLPQAVSYDIAPPTDASTSGFGYTDLGARARLWSDPAEVLSVQMVARLPGRHDDDNAAEIGNTDAELDMRALYGRSFKLGAWQAFTDTQLGYRARFGDAPSEVRADLTLGVRPYDGLLLLAQSFNTIADGSADGIFADGREHKVQLSAVWTLDEAWALQLGGIATVAGENALRERGVIAALWRKF